MEGVSLVYLLSVSNLIWDICQVLHHDLDINSDSYYFIVVIIIFVMFVIIVPVFW